MIRIYPNDTQAEAHFLKVKSILQNRIRSVIRRNGITKKGNKVGLNSNLKVYLNSLLNDDELKKLITARPDKLIKIIGSIKRKNKLFIKKTTAEGQILYNIFIDNAYDKLDKLYFIKNFGLDTCLYCNRNYIFALEKVNKIKPQIDHFYPKSIYPFLGISYYNLLPCCQTCNSFDAKGESDPYKKISRIINPYLLSDGQFKFDYKIVSIDILNPFAPTTSVEVFFSKKIDTHLKVFKLDKLYEQHADHVIELITKSNMKYSENYRKYLNSYPGLKMSNKEINRLILGNYAETLEIHKRPLAKLYQDIGEDLGLIQ
jgi:hypothetical protein